MTTHNLAVMSDPRWLGAAGLLPFFGLAVMSWLPGAPQSLVTQALLGYGAVILSFVGALHWGLAMAMPSPGTAFTARLYVWSVVPALVAWLAMLLPVALAVAILIAGLWLHYVQDRRLAHLITLPEWYLPLRLKLTSAANLALVLAWPRLV